MKRILNFIAMCGLGLYLSAPTGAGETQPANRGVPNRHWTEVSDTNQERALGLEDRMVQIRFPHPQIDEKWTAGSGTLVLRSNVVLTAAHTFYSVKNTGNGCSCSPRLGSSGGKAIAGMKDVSVRLFRPDDTARRNEVGIEKAFPDNHCRFVQNVRGQCMIPPEHDFVALKLSGFLIGGNPIQTQVTSRSDMTGSFQLAGFPTELDGDRLVTSACTSAQSPPSRWSLPTIRALGGPACNVGQGMSGGPVARKTSSQDLDLEGIVLAAQRERVIYRKRDEQVDRCLRAAAAWDQQTRPPETVLALGYTGAEDCPVIER